jgi:hypothetical protein
VRQGAAILTAVVVALAAWSATFCILRFSKHASAELHGWIIGAAAAIFGLSEMFFAKLLSELSNVLRLPGYSVWQSERLRQIIIPFKQLAWRLWAGAQLFRAVAGFCAVILVQKKDLEPKALRLLICVAYPCLIVATFVTSWTWRQFVKVEKFRDDVAHEELIVKEKKRLSSELNAGKEHDFSADKNLKKPTEPPEKI